MISAVAWRHVPESDQLVTHLPEVRADVTIAWDAVDRSLYLSVVIPPAPNVQGAQARVYAGPLTLLAAQLIVPRELHQWLRSKALAGYGEVQGVAMEAVQQIVQHAPEAWPNVAKVVKEAEGLTRTAADLERLALDLATEDAFRET